MIFLNSNQDCHKNYIIRIKMATSKTNRNTHSYIFIVFCFEIIRLIKRHTRTLVGAKICNATSFDYVLHI